jgi:branched-chain amino acid aminotransferase
MSKVFLNDQLVDEDQAFVSVADGGLLYGAGLFETLRSSHGVVFRLDAHLDRLFSSAVKLAIDLTFDRTFVDESISSVLEANGLQDARLRLTVTSGPVSAPEGQRQSTLLIAATALQGYPDEYYNKGIRVMLCPYRQNPSDPLAGHKSTSYLPRMLGLRLAHQNGAAEALWFTPDGHLAEACVSNVFLVQAGVLLTPPLDTPVLPGIARDTLAGIARQESIEWTERKLTVDELLGADEVFLTNIIMKVLPVTGIEKHTVGSGRVGPVSRRLLTAFNEQIEMQCGKGK